MKQLLHDGDELVAEHNSVGMPLLRKTRSGFGVDQMTQC